MTKKLPSEYKFVELTNDEYQKLWNEWGPKVFLDDSTTVDIRSLLCEEERAQLKKLNQNTANLLRINLGIFKGDQFCGWFSGDQYNYETFYMRNSAILPQFRRQGLYTALMNEVLARTSALGFQVVFSRHATTNNAIIIPKLKAGFMITAIEVSDRFGTLVNLSYFFNETRKKVLEFRAGERKPDAQLKIALGIT